MQSLFEKMGGTYRREGDYLIPNLALSDTRTYDIGKYGRMRRRYLKEYHPAIYHSLMLSEKLYSHLAKINQACNERMERICADMAKREGVTEALKASSPLEWVGRMNNIRSRAEEMICAELVYAEERGA